MPGKLGGGEAVLPFSGCGVVVVLVSCESISVGRNKWGSALVVVVVVVVVVIVVVVVVYRW